MTMKTPIPFNAHRFVCRAATILSVAVALASGGSVNLAGAAGPPLRGVEALSPATDAGALKRPEGRAPEPGRQPVPWSELGARATAQYSGDGLQIRAAGSGTATAARLRCLFQRLEGEATTEGLWLISTVTNGSCLSLRGAEGQAEEPMNDRFRVVAASVGRGSDLVGTSRCDVSARVAAGGTVALPQSRASQAAQRAFPTPFLQATGSISIDGQTVRFIRAGLVEEYTVSMDGVRQDFVVMEKPAGDPPSLSPDGVEVARRAGEGALRVELAVTGAKLEPLGDGVQLVLEKSGRKIAYSRLRVRDATGRELPARMEMQRALAFSLQPSAFPLAVLADDTGAVYPIRI